MITYWAIINPDTNVVDNVCLADGEDWQEELEQRNPGELVVRCNLADEPQTEAGIGYTYDVPTGWFIPIRPELDEDDIYFDRDLWKWRVPSSENAVEDTEEESDTPAPE